MRTPSTVLDSHRQLIRLVVESHRARNPRVFGSVLGRRDSAGSDLDLLVDPLADTTLFDLGALQVELEACLGIPVDVLTPGDLPERFRERVLAEAEPV
jgi:predicted nucleotidyltransferase